MIKRKDIYDMYWYFAFERQNIFYNKLLEKPEPYTEDKILQNYKFCNTYRVLDRISQYLLRNVIYNGTKYNNSDMIFRIVLFKIFNKEETWELFINNLGDVLLSNFSFEVYNKILTNAKNEGTILYNDAYISCATKAFGYDKKHENHLELLNKMFVLDKIHEKIVSCSTMYEAFNILRSYPLIGDFISYQLVTDINYSDATNFDECSFTVVGPGSKRGIKKCFTSLDKNSYEDIIRYMYENQEREFKRLGLDFKYLDNRKLQLIDIQNLFCELDKYLREAKPELKSNRKNIKKKYVPKSQKIGYIFPDKWNIKKGDIWKKY